MERHFTEARSSAEFGDLALVGTTISNNRAASGGGIYVGRFATLTDSTVTGNVATGDLGPLGGGICFDPLASLTVTKHNSLREHAGRLLHHELTFRTSTKVRDRRRHCGRPRSSHPLQPCAAKAPPLVQQRTGTPVQVTAGAASSRRRRKLPRSTRLRRSPYLTIGSGFSPPTGATPRSTARVRADGRARPRSRRRRPCGEGGGQAEAPCSPSCNPGQRRREVGS